MRGYLLFTMIAANKRNVPAVQILTVKGELQQHSGIQ